MTTKAKGLRLNRADRDRVRRAVLIPLVEQLLEARKTARSALARRMWENTFTPAQQKQLQSGDLKEFFVSGALVYFYDRTNEKRRTGMTVDRPVPNSSFHYQVDGSLLDEERAIMTRFGSRSYVNCDELENHGERGLEIQKVVAELNSVLLTAKTRAELGVIWPQVYDLMGATWVDAVKEPITLPSLQTANLDAAVQALKAAA